MKNMSKMELEDNVILSSSKKLYHYCDLLRGPKYCYIFL